MKKIKTITLSFLLIIFFACTNDDNTTNLNINQLPNPTTFSQNFGNEITRNFLGNVIDKNNNPIENVSITIGNSIAQTDNNGVFIIRDATINERFGYVKAEKTGYIHGSRSVVPTSGTNKVTIMLLEETVVGTTNSGTAETISLPNGASVALEGEYIKEDGTAYSGSVNVIMHFLDPSDENMINQMPGMLYAANANNEERMLQTFGMLAVELRGSSGEDLNLAEGSSAEIRVPVDASLLTNALNSIPLWYFDEAAGYWKEDGVATLVGDSYIGTVTHFSFWNYDAQFPAVNLCITVTDENGNLIANQNVTLTHSNSSYPYPTSSGYTNENGEVCGLVPSNETLEINLYSWDICGNSSIYYSIIGPFSIDDAISITVSNTVDTISETVVGSFNTCDGNPVTEGYVALSYGGQTFTDFISDGSFEINLIHCTDNNTFSIQASDYVNLQITDSINYTFTTPLTNIGTITACNDVTEFITYSIDDGLETLLITEFISAVLGSNMVGVTIIGQSSDNCFTMSGSLIPAPYEGTYDFLDWNDPNDTGFMLFECIDMSVENNNVIYNLTLFGEVGEYIDINFSGDYEDSQGVTHTIVGVIHVIRDI